MAPLVIQVSHLCKHYRLGTLGSASLAEEFGRWLARLSGRPDPNGPVLTAPSARGHRGVFKALEDVSFDVRQGEVLGIIGRNGAGKSTLLKLLSRITVPTAGQIAIKGRIASLLEVGTGFHPELTGRENIFLNGAILGMRHAEIEARLDRIIAFSGIEHHIDTPVKRYSSGMKVRLGFAVAAHLEPEILVVDEVLAVGDADFQRKCLGKMKDVSDSGRTILFVSHNMTAMLSLCSRVIWIENGTIAADGEPQEVVNAYLRSYAHGEERIAWDIDDAPGTERVRLTSAEVVRPKGDLPITMNTPFRIRVGLDNRTIDDDDLNVGVRVINDQDVVVFASTLAEGVDERPRIPPGRFEVECHIPGDLMNEGSYHVVVNVFRGARLYFGTDRVLSFTVHAGERKGGWFGKQAGVLRPKLLWSATSQEVR